MLFCPLNKGLEERKRSKLSKDHKLQNEMYNRFFKFIGRFFNET